MKFSKGQGMVMNEHVGPISSTVAASPSLRGVLLIGDPHLESRQPGFRSDDYPRVILNKLRWCLDFAATERLLPVLLGDLFERPRDNPNWMIGELITMLQGRGAIGIYGNHDCAGTALDDDDSLTLLVKAGVLRLIHSTSPWCGTMNGRRVVIGGSPWRQKVPRSYEPEAEDSAAATGPAAFVMWLTHHDIITPGYEEGRMASREIPGIDLVINGHIHRALDPVQRGRTLWLTPGNISRRSRSSAAREHTPSVLRIDVFADRYQTHRLTVPHREACHVFHPAVLAEVQEGAASRFVDGLRELQLRRTESGAGLHQFLEQNLDQFDEPVAAEIRRLADHVTGTRSVHG